jgi:putative transposase
MQWMREHEGDFSVHGMCRVLGVERSSYYAWRRRPVCDRAVADGVLLAKIRKIFVSSRETYGSPRVHAALRSKGILCSEKRVARLMRQNGLISVRRRKFRPQTTDSNHEHPIAENLLARDFTASAPNQRWVGDITYLWTAQGWLYVAVIIDLFSRKVVGWASSASLNSELACRALDMAIFRRGKPKDLVYHSDRGVQYASLVFRQRLKSYGVTPSMSRKGNCWDNAVAESFFDTFKVEFVHRYKFTSRESARIDFIEEFYNVNRIHSSLGFFSPAEFEKQANCS